MKRKEEILCEFTGEEIKSPLKAIRKKCIDCCCSKISEVDNCPVTKCELYPFRFGKNPYTNRKQMTEEQKEAFKTRIKNTRYKKEINNDE